MSFEYNYPMAAHTSDMIVFRNNPIGSFGRGDKPLEVLLIRRGGEPFKGMLALPGGFANPFETLKRTAIRETFEEVGLVVNPDDVKFVGYYDDPKRDPRGWTITNAYYTFVDEDAVAVAGDDAASAQWYDVGYVITTSTMAFDHKQILIDAVKLYEAQSE